MMRAELISRSTDPKERVVALAEAARCLLLLEADLGQAEALAREASALSSRTGVAPRRFPTRWGCCARTRAATTKVKHSSAKR